MGFRFRKSIKLFPGVRINLSKSGVSTSIGKPGATINISERGTRGTVGLPGTGMSYSQPLQTPERPAPEPSPDATPSGGGMGLAALLGWGLVAFLAILLISALAT